MSKPRKQVNIALVVLPDCMASSVHSVLDIFQVANQVYAYQCKDSALQDYFSLQLFSADGKPVRTTNGQTITVDHAIDHTDRCADIVIVSGAFTANYPSNSIQSYLSNLGTVISWIQAQSLQGATIATACTGAFVLVEAGLFKEKKQATTHWMLANKFKRRYPNINYNDQKLVLEYPRLFCAAATTAFTDLTIRLIRSFSSKEVALMTAKLMLADPYRELQKPFHHLHQGKAHQDTHMIKAQEWIEQHYANKILIDDLAAHLAMGTRNFKRRFKQATGITPLLYLQQVRVESAKHLLEVSTQTSQQIINHVGYEDLSSFGRLFKKHTGLTLEEYRRRFSSKEDITDDAGH